MTKVQARDARNTEFLREAEADLRRVRHAPAEAGEVVHRRHQIPLAVEPSIYTQQRPISLGLLLRGDHADGVCDHAEHAGGGGRDLGLLAHIHGCGFEAGVALDRQLLESVAHLVGLGLGQDEPALALLAGAGGAADAVDVGLAVAGQAHLDDVGDVGEVHAARCHVGGEENAGLAAAEVVGGAGALGLRQAAVDLVDAGGGEGVVCAAGATGGGSVGAEVAEDGGGEVDFGCGVEVDDCLERSSAGLLGGLDLAAAELDQGGDGVLEAVDSDELLRHALVGWLLVVADRADELEAWAESLVDELDDFPGDSGAEHQGLARLLLDVGKEIHNLADLGVETLVEESVGLIEDKRVETRCGNTAVPVAEDIL